MTESTDGDFDVAEAYAATTPDDHRELYRKWADTYESGFIASRGYIYHERVAELFVERVGAVPRRGAVVLDGAVLDVGCGTGIVGEALVSLGITAIDGIDISPEMIEKAAAKSTDADPVYRAFIEADLTQPIAIASDSYVGVISVGTFTLGHVGPEALAELFRVGAPGCVYALGINRAHFVERGFETQLDAAVAAAVITPYELTEIRMYQNDGDEHSTDTAFVARFAKTGGLG